jgi:putative oxidoreductase
MAKFMAFLNNQTYALMRIVVGFLFLWHGTQKLFGYPPPGMPAMGEPPWYITYVAGPIELVGGALVMVGLFTRQAAFLCSGLMAFAYWMAHGHKALFPIQNGGELAALYCFVFLFISTQGSSVWSLDKVRGAG